MKRRQALEGFQRPRPWNLTGAVSCRQLGKASIQRD